MTYVIPPTGSKRVKHTDQQGHEELEAHDKAAFQAAATAAAVQGGKATTGSSEEADAPRPPPVATPREVIEKLTAAKGELDVVLDLINLMEGQHFLGVANIALPSNLHLEHQEEALRLQQKVSQLKDAGRRLRAGASALKSHASTSQFFFAQLAQLQQHWNLKRSPPGGPGRFQIDVALPLGRQWQLHRSTQQPDTLIDVIQGPDGAIKLQSAGLPLPDQPLRWLAPLNRPLLYLDPPAGSRHSPAADTVGQATPALLLSDPTHPQTLTQLDTPSPMQVDLNQPALQQHETPESRQAVSDGQLASHQASLQGQTHSAAAGEVPSEPAPMQVDNPLQAPHPPALHPASNSHDVQPAAQQHASPQAPLQMVPVPAGLHDIITANVARCDRQLLGRQEQVLASLLQQRVAEEVRLVQGAEDMDHPADDLVQKVFAPAAPVNPLLEAVQLRLLRLLLLDPDHAQSQTLLAQLQQ
ncbi:hypothetical protein ABBQ32_006303 [Trebouxia sp. C0010 RCD-2024]